MRRQFVHTLFTVILSGCALMACRKDALQVENTDNKIQTNGEIVFGVSHTGEWSGSVTKSDAGESKSNNIIRTESLLMDSADGQLPEEKIYVYMIEEDYEAQDASQEPLTRSTGEGTVEVSDDSYHYGVYGYLGVGESTPDTYPIADDTTILPFVQNLGLTAWYEYHGNPLYAPGEGAWLQFYIYSPYYENPSSNSNKFTISTEDNYPVLNYSNTAADTDILFGGTGSPIAGTVDEVDLSISHILSNVSVKVGSISCGTITKYSFNGIKSEGVYNASNSGIWSDVQTPYDYEQSTPSIDDETKILGSGLYLIPQEFTDNTAQLEFELCVENINPEDDSTRQTTYVLTKNLSDFIEEWEPNKKYTFVITTPHEVEVEIDDEVDFEGDYPVKKNLKITNTGLVPAYVRVSLHGSWVVDEKDSNDNDIQVCVADWKEADDETPDGEFVNITIGTAAVNGWIKHTDGYYYYLYPLDPDETCEELFSKYILRANAPMVGAYLELVILAQAVFVDDVQYAFPAEVLEKLLD